MLLSKMQCRPSTRKIIFEMLTCLSLAAKGLIILN
jgi:hypothetical protein